MTKEAGGVTLVDDVEARPSSHSRKILIASPEYLNVYYRGCSLLKREYVTQRPFGKTDYKYLVPPNRVTKPFSIRIGWRVVHGRPAGSDPDVVDAHVRYPRRVTTTNSRTPLSAATQYKEKSGVHDFIHGPQRPLALDIEVSFPGVRLQIDLATLNEVDNQTVIAVL